MSGYVIADIEITDPDGYAAYVKTIGSTVAQYGGAPLVMARKFAIVEGDTNRTLQVVLKFPTLDDAVRWYNSPEYAPGIVLRRQASTSTLVIVEGLD